MAGDFDEMRRLVEDVPYLPSLLNFSKSSGPDSIYFGEGRYVFTGAFYFEIDAEYASLDSSYAPFAGKNGTNGEVFRLLIGTTTTIVNLYSNSPNLTYSKATTTNTRYVVKVRRNSSNQVFVSYDGGAETNIGTMSGQVRIKYIGFGGSRYLTGKVYRFDINGDEYLLTEGSGDKVYGSLGGVGTILTSNAGGLSYINSTMWEAL